MLFQQDLDLTVLHVKKYTYQDAEHKMLKFHKILTPIFLLPFFIDILLKWVYYIYYKDHEVTLDTTTNSWYRFEQLSLIIYCLNCFGTFLIFSTIGFILPQFLHKLYVKHRATYDTHKWKYLLQAGSCLVTSSIILVFSFYNAEAIICGMTDGAV